MQNIEYELIKSFKIENEDVHAGFWKRMLAHVIDVLIINCSVILLVIIAIFISQGSTKESYNNMVLASIITWSVVTPLIIYPIYQAIMESRNNSATLGKMMLGIIVIGSYGQKNTFGRALGRAYIKVAVNTMFIFAHIMAAFEKNKRSLHDLALETYVINKRYLGEIYNQHYQNIGNVNFNKVLSSDEIKKMIKVPTPQALANNTITL